jgi:hypothetical protein
MLTLQAAKRAEKDARDAARREEELRTYKHVMTEDAMTTVKENREKYENPEDYEDDFL